MTKNIIKIDNVFDKDRQSDRIFLGSLGIEDDEFHYILSKNTYDVTVLHLCIFWDIQAINNISWFALMQMKEARWANLTDLNLGTLFVI